MAQVDKITQMIRNAQADAIRKNGTANGQAIQNDTVKFLKESIEQQKATAKSVAAPAAEPATTVPTVKDTRTTQQKHDDAKKAYDDYVASDEHRQRLADANRKEMDDAMRRIFAAPGSASDILVGAGQQIPTDSKERELNAMVEHYKQQMDQEESQRIRDADMKEIESWSDEDREQLQKYISSDSKTGNLLVNSNPLLWFGANKSLGDSAKYLYGKYGEEKTKQLASSYSRYLNETEAKKIEEDTKNAVDQGTMSTIGQNILGLGTRLFGGLQATADRFGEALDRDERYPTLAPYTSGDLISLHGNTVTAQTAQNIAGEDGGILRQGAAYLYQGGMTMMDSFLRAAAGGGATGGAAIAACNAFSQTVSQASQQGATPEQAYTLGAAVAGVEYLSEKIPMDEVFKLAKGGNVNVLKQAFKQTGIEISTEELSLLGSMAAEAAILREKSSYKQQIGDLVANGASYEEAKAQADKGVWEEVKQTALVSGFAGFLSGGGGAIVGNLTAQPEAAAETVQETADAASVEEAVQPETTSFLDDAAQQLAQEAPAAAPVELTPEQQMVEQAAAETMGVPSEAQPTVDTNQTAEYDNNTITVPGATVGRSDVTYTADNKPVQFRYAVVPAESLITSNDQFGNVNSAYPAELQPRDRTRAASQTQINSMSRNLNPALLAESPTAQNGAPIIRGDGVVIGGNGRVSAIAQAYGAGRGAEYQQYITQRAAELGIDPATLPANPVLVRVTDGVDNYAELASSLNASTTASYSATEAANADAGKIGDIIEYLSVSEDGGINTADNRDFIQKFVAHVVPETERGDVMQANGQLSQAGERRIQNALFAYAYGDTALVERLAESTDNNAKNITNAMMGAAGKVAQLQTEIDRGEVQDLGLQNAITDAVNLYLDAKAGKQTVEDASGQLSIGDNGPEAQYDGLTVHLAKFMESNNRSGLQIRKFIDILVDVNMNTSAETATEVSMFDTGDQQTQEGLYDEAVTAYDQHRDGKGRIPEKSDFSQYRQYQPGELAGSMDGGGTEGDSGTAASDGRIPQTVQGDVPGGQRPVKGTGAAEADFSGKPAYNATLAEDNAQADRRDDVRPMELPKQDVNGGNISAVTGNVYGSKITPDELASLMEEPTARGDFTYAKITNDQATELAVDTISRCGDWNTAYSQWVREVDRGVAGAEMTARGALLLNHAAQEGDKGKWLDILSDMQRLGTNTAQGLQAFRIIRTLSAPDRIEFAKMTVRKMVEDLNLGVDIEIDEALLDEYEQAQTDEERDAILLDIQQNVADQIPSTLLDKWTALRYMNMLGNLKTNVRNVMGNVGSSLVYRMKDQIATTMERITGTQRTKSHTVSRELLTVCKQDFEQFKDVVSSGGKYSDNLSSNDQFRQGVMDKRRVFKNPLLEGYRKGTNWMMNNGIFGDEAFGRAAYARALAGFLKANGITAEQFQQMVNEKPKSGTGTPKAIIPEGTRVKAADRDNYGTIQKYNEADNTYLVQFVSPKGHTANVNLSADILSPVGKKTDALGPVPKPEQKMEFVDYARAYAIREAQEATFHDNSALAEIMSNVQKSTGIIGQAIIPFTKTPANVLTRAVEFSPLGIIDSTVKTIQAKRDVDISGADIVNSWAKTMTGTALFALGAAMMDQGLLSGGPDEDEEKAEFDELNGKQNYALRLPNGTYYTIDWLTPAAMPMFMGAQFWDIISGEGDLTFADMEKVFTSIADPMIQMSMLQGLNDSLDGIKHSNNNLGQFFINAAVSYLSQGLTNTLFGQIERSTEENRQTTYIDKDSNIPEWMQRQLGKASQKIPGWDFQQMDYRNAWGQTEENEGGLLYNMLSPGYVSKEQSNQITQELYRLRETTGENVFPQPVDKTITYTDVTGEKHVNRALTQSELDTIQRVEGQTAMRLMAEVVMNGDYKSLTDNQRAEVMSNIYKYAQEQGKKEALSDYYSEAAAWLQNIGDDAANSLIRRSALSTIDASVTKIVDNIENEWAVSPAAQKELDGLFDAYNGMSREAQKQILDDAVSDTAKYLEIRSKGIDTTQYLDVVRGIKALEVEPNYSDIRDIQVREAIADSSSLSRVEKDYVMKAYMPDYNPNAKQPQTTELKYDAIRELGVSPEGYTDSYRDYLEASGTGKRRRTIAYYMKTYGWDRATAQKVYDLYAGYWKPWNE